MCGILFFRILNAKRKEEYVKLYSDIRNAIGSRGPESRNDLYFERDGVYLTFHRLATYGELDSANMMPL
jgi:asparagine synthase (glutamine-hydrolysing)